MEGILEKQPSEIFLESLKAHTSYYNRAITVCGNMKETGNRMRKQTRD